ncbi:hypothetical protein N7468_001002 [Penicillium chermesinum]|uniref:Uncharacterized protein n=1 Tax=Penicillium chermesinum TaxID=63820 RepID=A0A9W9PFR6_9EURO|nr:uncharacterized protein N7468_001002 [Penicillium chermesinum]KAJ5246019.1 hypothetical protein N7468_001002 [Penicillium chermesinum]
MSDFTIAPDPDLYLPASARGQEPEDWKSETTSIASSLYKGFIENGRRYQTLRSSGYFSPSDERQFETYEVGHILCLLMNIDQPNPLFNSPVTAPKHVLDIGTGQGSWAVDVADMFPDAVKFDLIHLRHGIGAFSPEEWDNLLKQCYDNLEPGGWFEQIEMNLVVDCDDDSIPPDSILRTWGPRFSAAGEKSGRPLDITKTMRATIEKAGFVDVHEKYDKWPIGAWPRDKSLKEAGLVNVQHWLAGMEGYSMYLLTKFGDPVPWTKEEVLVYIAEMRKALKNPHYHPYQRGKRVWARKPFPDEVAIKSEPHD